MRDGWTDTSCVRLQMVASQCRAPLARQATVRGLLREDGDPRCMCVSVCLCVRVCVHMLIGHGPIVGD